MMVDVGLVDVDNTLGVASLNPRSKMKPPKNSLEQHVSSETCDFFFKWNKKLYSCNCLSSILLLTTAE